MKFADLHLHTQFSDGTFTPEELVLRAQNAGPVSYTHLTLPTILRV